MKPGRLGGAGELPEWIRTPQVVSAAFALLLALAVPRSGAAESVTFYFAPPVGQSFVVRETQDTEIRIGGNRSRSTIAALSTVRLQKEAASFYVVSRYDQMAASTDGGPFETPPPIRAMMGSEIIHVLRNDGSLARVDGYRQIAAKALPLMTGEAKKSLEKYVAEGRQTDRDRASWYEMEMIAGQTLELDRDYWFDAAWADESGWMRHQTLLRLGPWVTHPKAERLLTVNLAYVANAQAQIPGATRIFPKLRSALDPLQPGAIAPGQRIEGSATWWIDPASMMVWKLGAFRKVSAPVHVSSELGVTLVTEEKTEKSLEPAPAAPGR